jgi:hypothetical protein
MANAFKFRQAKMSEFVGLDCRIVKTLSLTLVLTVAATLAQGQGLIGFNNGILSRVTICAGGVPPRNATIADNLHMGIFVGTDEWSLRMMPETPLAVIQPGNADGVFSVPGGNAYAIPGFAFRSQPFAQVRVWGIAFGLDWQRALMTPGTPSGQTDVRQLMPLGQSPSPGTPIWQTVTGTNPNLFRPLVLYTALSDPCIPEPGAWALLGLGLAALACRLKRKEHPKP